MQKAEKHPPKNESIQANGIAVSEVLTAERETRWRYVCVASLRVALSLQKQMFAPAGVGFRVWAQNQRGCGLRSGLPIMIMRSSV